MIRLCADGYPQPKIRQTVNQTYSELGHAVSADGISRVIIHDALVVGGMVRRQLRKERERDDQKVKCGRGEGMES